MATITILLSHERSGSHFLGEFLSSLSNVAMFDEVCNPDAVKPLVSPSSFFRFRHEAITNDASLLLEPTREKHRDFVLGYFQHLLALKSPRNIVVDIKYGHVQNFEWCWWPILEQPFLMRLCETEAIGILHLYRENVVEATASAMIADRRNVWHSWEKAAAKTADRTFDLPIQNLIRRSKLLERQTSLFKGWIRAARNTSVTYERIAADLGRGGALDSALAAFVGGMPDAAFTPRHQKITRPLPEVVENYAELKAACEAAGLGAHLPVHPIPS